MVVEQIERQCEQRAHHSWGQRIGFVVATVDHSVLVAILVVRFGSIAAVAGLVGCFEWVRIRPGGVRFGR